MVINTVTTTIVPAITTEQILFGIFILLIITGIIILVIIKLSKRNKSE
jgi:hypothetical protein